MQTDCSRQNNKVWKDRDEKALHVFFMVSNQQVPNYPSLLRNDPLEQITIHEMRKESNNVYKV